MSHSHTRSIARRALRLEPLENRTLLAGNVTVSVAGDHLKLRGDQECNGVVVVQLAAGQYAVAGFEHDGAPTTINGGTEPVILSGIRGNFDIDLRKGDDLLAIGNDIERIAELADDIGFGDIIDPGSTFGLDEIPDIDLQVPRSLFAKTKDGEDGVVVVAQVNRSMHVNTGRDADGIAIGDSTVGNDVILRTEKGEDGVLIENTTVDDHLNVHTGRDGDTVLANGSNLGHALLMTGQGNDSLGVSDTDVQRELVMRTEGGGDTVLVSDAGARRIDIDTGSTGDSLTMNTFEVADDVIVRMGGGSDQALIEDSLVGGDLLLFLGSDDDELAVNNLGISDDLLINAGPGQDLVQVQDSDVDEFFEVYMGANNDTLTIASSTAARAILRGGSSFDEFNVDSLTFAPDVDQRQFEEVNVAP